MYGVNDCLALFVALKYLLPKSAFDDYFGELKRAVERLENQLPLFAYQRVLQEMGLLGQWQRLAEFGR